MRTFMKKNVYSMVFIFLGICASVLSYNVGALVGGVETLNRFQDQAFLSRQVEMVSWYRTWEMVDEVLASGSLEERKRVAAMLRKRYEPFKILDADLRKKVSSMKSPID